MDNRLDFFNTVIEYEKTLTEDDAFYVISHNTKYGDLLVATAGNVDILSAALANDEGEYINFSNNEQKEKHEQAKKVTLNIAINILRTDENLRDKFKDVLNNI